MNYDDEYPTCQNTFATLRLFDAHGSPTLVSSKDHVSSKDLRRHVEWVLDLIDTDSSLRERVAAGRADVSCFWVSASGHGGPTLSPTQMSRLAAYDLELWIDFYDADQQDA